MKRRELIALFGGAAAWPIAAFAQQSERMRRIGVLTGADADDLDMHARIEAFEDGLKQGVKQTSLGLSEMSASDPKRTSDAALCRGAQQRSSLKHVIGCFPRA